MIPRRTGFEDRQAVNRAMQRDFAREWAESLRLKQKEPLGEVEIERMMEEG